MRHHLESERRAILGRMLEHVPFEGWSAASLKTRVADLGYPPSMAARAFPGGVREVVSLFNAETDRRMRAALAERDLGALRVRERVAAAVRCRLELVAPHREAVRGAVAFSAHPANAPAALAELYRTIDDMWRACGDTATDFSFYTKRALLAAVYSSTLLYWFDDRSPDCADTWAFLDRRIAEVMKIGALRGRLERFAKAVTPAPRRGRGRGRA